MNTTGSAVSILPGASASPVRIPDGYGESSPLLASVPAKGCEAGIGRFIFCSGPVGSRLGSLPLPRFPLSEGGSMTGKMRETLQAARKQALRRVHDDQPGQPSWPAAPNTLAALVRHGLLEKTKRRDKNGRWMTVWPITQDGLDALRPREVFVDARPVYLQRTAGYSTSRARAVEDAGEVMDPDVLVRWARSSEGRRLGSRSRREVARRLAAQARRAA